MAKAKTSVPRRRGRPKADNDALIDDVLVEWLRTGGSPWRGLDQAVQAVATEARADREGIKRKSLLERVHEAVKDATSQERLLRAFDIAQQRGVSLPRNWLTAMLAELYHHTRKLDALNQSLASTRLTIERRAAEADRSRRMEPFHSVFDHILPPLADMGPSELAGDFAACEQVLRDRKQRRKK